MKTPSRNIIFKNIKHDSQKYYMIKLFYFIYYKYFRPKKFRRDNNTRNILSSLQISQIQLDVLMLA